jgi:hypothetical protein
LPADFFNEANGYQDFADANRTNPSPVALAEFGPQSARKHTKPLKEIPGIAAPPDHPPKVHR